MNDKAVLGRVAAAWFALAMAAPAGATLITEALQNAVFNDGGTATGSFTYDTSNNTITQFSISVAGGDTATFAPVTYDAANAVSFVNPTSFQFQFIDNSRYLWLSLVNPLPTGGGADPFVIAADPKNPSFGESYECDNCGSARSFVTGQLDGIIPTSNTSGNVPEPATLGLLGLGLAGLARSRMRRD